MPKEADRLVRHMYILSSIPAIAYTTYTRAEDRTRCLAKGYQMHIAKPADPGELAAAISSLAAAARSDKPSGA